MRPQPPACSLPALDHRPSLSLSKPQPATRRAQRSQADARHVSTARQHALGSYSQHVLRLDQQVCGTRCSTALRQQSQPRQVVLTDRLRESTGETGAGLRTTLTDTQSSSQTVVSLHSPAVTSAAPRAPRRQERRTRRSCAVQPVGKVPEACLTPQDRNVWRLRAVTEVTGADMSNCRFGRSVPSTTGPTRRC